MKIRYKIFLTQMFSILRNSKGRVLLVFVGVGISVFLFSLSSLLIDAWFNGKLEEYEKMPGESCYIVATELAGEYTELYLQTETPIVFEEPGSGVSIDITARVVDAELFLMGNCHGVSRESEVLFAHSAEHGTNMVSAELKEGRLITEEDNYFGNHVIVIDELLAGILFGTESAIGQYVSLQDGKVKAQVIGVLKNHYYTSLELQKSKETLQDPSLDTILICSNIYCPVFLLEELYGYTPETIIFLWNDMDDALMSQIEATHEITKMANVSDIITKQKILEDTIQQLKPYRLLTYAITIALLVISGVSSMSIMLFSLKERVCEIGVRKAFGASRFQIQFQYLCESLMICFVAVVLFCGLACICGALLCGYVEETIGVRMVFAINVNTLLLCVFVGLVQGGLFSLIPSHVAANLRAADSLRC